MTEIEKKALALVNEVRLEMGLIPYEACEAINTTWFTALCRAIEQHKAYRQEVSEIVEQYVTASTRNAAREWERLKGLIIAKPDPLVEAIKACDLATLDGIEDTVAHDLRAAMNARGYEWTKIVEDK